MGVSRELEILEAIRSGVTGTTPVAGFVAHDARDQKLASRELPLVTYTVLGAAVNSFDQPSDMRPIEYRNLEVQDDVDPYTLDVLRIHRYKREMVVSLHVFADPDLAETDPANAENVVSAVIDWLNALGWLTKIQKRFRVLALGPARDMGSFQHTEGDALAHWQVDVTLEYAATTALQIGSIERVEIQGQMNDGQLDPLPDETEAEVETPDYRGLVYEYVGSEIRKKT